MKGLDLLVSSMSLRNSPLKRKKPKASPHVSGKAPSLDKPVKQVGPPVAGLRSNKLSVKKY
tara:strand:- start:229 stop:411 length:183 start_codon:yes stop_codon:yes gene_type:complete